MSWSHFASFSMDKNNWLLVPSPETASLSLLFLILNKNKSFNFFRKVMFFWKSVKTPCCPPASTVHLWPFLNYVISFAAVTILAHIQYIILPLPVRLEGSLHRKLLPTWISPFWTRTIASLYHGNLEFWLFGFFLFCGILIFTDYSLLLYASHKWKYWIELDQEESPVDAHWIIPKCKSKWWITFWG